MDWEDTIWKVSGGYSGKNVFVSALQSYYIMKGADIIPADVDAATSKQSEVA